MIPQSRPNLERKDFAYIKEILGSGQVAQGALVDSFERDFARELGVEHALAVSHGTAALHLALLALGISKGDEVIIPSYVCASVLNAVDYTGAKPVLADIDAETFNLTSALIRSKLTKRTRAIVLTHTFGFPADIESISKLGVPIIEDCAQALGAQYKQKPVGSFGRVSVFSFYATKMLCAGEGGMVCTNDKKIAGRLRDLNTPDKRQDYRVRYNYNMSDLTAGLAASQLSRLQRFVEKRRKIATRYRSALAEFPIRMQTASENSQPCYYRFVVRSEKAAAVFRQAQKAGVMCDRPVFRPLHHHRPTREQFKNTESVWESGISIPLYPDLSNQEVEEIVSVMTGIFERL